MTHRPHKSVRRAAQAAIATREEARRKAAESGMVAHGHNNGRRKKNR